MIGERHRRLAQRLRMRSARHVDDRRHRGAAAAAPAAEPMRSASRMMASSVSTVFTGYRPTAVSPASMIASTPSSTALAASLTSARVGRGSSRIDSSTCVATMTGMPAAAGFARDLFLRRRHLLERHLEPEIAARHHHALRHFQDLVQVIERFGPLDLGDQRNVGAPISVRICRACHMSSARAHEAQRNHVDAKLRAELQIVDVFRRQRLCRQAARRAR